MPSTQDAQRQAYQLANPAVAFNPDAAICKKWLALKAAGTYLGVPIGDEVQLGALDGKPRAAQAFTSGAILVWYGGGDVRVE